MSEHSSTSRSILSRALEIVRGPEPAEPWSCTLAGHRLDSFTVAGLAMGLGLLLGLALLILDASGVVAMCAVPMCGFCGKDPISTADTDPCGDPRCLDCLKAGHAEALANLHAEMQAPAYTPEEIHAEMQAVHSAYCSAMGTGVSQAQMRTTEPDTCTATAPVQVSASPTAAAVQVPAQVPSSFHAGAVVMADVTLVASPVRATVTDAEPEGYPKGWITVELEEGADTGTYVTGDTVTIPANRCRAMEEPSPVGTVTCEECGTDVPTDDGSTLWCGPCAARLGGQETTPSGTLANPVELPTDDPRSTTLHMNGEIWSYRGDWADYVVREEARKSERRIGQMPASGDYPASLYVQVPTSDALVRLADSIAASGKVRDWRPEGIRVHVDYVAGLLSPEQRERLAVDLERRAPVAIAAEMARESYERGTRHGRTIGLEALRAAFTRAEQLADGEAVDAYSLLSDAVAAYLKNADKS